MVHQVASNRVAAIGGIGPQQDAWIFDGVGSQDDDAAGGAVLCSVPSLVENPRDVSFVVVELKLGHDRLGSQGCSCSERLLDVHDRFVTRLDGAQRDTGRVALARRTLVVGRELMAWGTVLT